MVPATRRPLNPCEQLIPIADAAKQLGLAPKSILNMLSAHRDKFTPRQYRRGRRMLTPDEIERLAALIQILVK